MIRMIIAEDEPAVRNAIAGSIDWEGMGIEIAGLAGSGLEALDLFETAGADILMTDIRMPGMDGLILIERAAALHPELVCILLTGYNDFGYAQRAIKLGVLDFILKPSNPAEIERSVRRAVELIERNRQLATNRFEMENRWRQNRGHLLSELIGRWLQSGKVPGEDRTHQLSELHSKLPCRSLVVALFHIPVASVERYLGHAGDQELIRYAAMNIIRETLEAHLNAPLEITRAPDGIAAVFHASGEAGSLNNQTQPLMEQVQSNLKHYLQLQSTVGVSGICPDLDHLNEAYEQARKTFDQRFLSGDGRIYFYAEHPPVVKDTEKAFYPNELHKLESHILEQLGSGNFESVSDTVQEWYNGLKRLEQGKKDFRMRVLTLHVKLQQFLENSAGPDAVPEEDLRHCADQIDMIETADELYALVTRMIQLVVSGLNRNKPVHKTVQQVLELVRDKYMTTLMLKHAAEETFVNSSYLSALFKQEMGINFLDYLHQYRIDQAKALLRQGHLKISEVAERVGYFDEAHFSRTFKKWTSLSPSQYQKEAGGKN